MVGRSVFILAMTCLLTATEAQARMASGRYNELLLGIDGRTRILTGYFASSRIGNGTEQAPQFSCMFYLRGRITDDEVASIRSWLPGEAELITGKLASKGGGVWIRLDQDPGGCAATLGRDLTSEPYDLEPDTQGNWTSVRVVRAARSYFHSGPDGGTATRAFVVRGDPLGVFRRANGWVEATFLSGEGKQTRGWIRERDLFPETPP